MANTNKATKATKATKAASTVTVPAPQHLSSGPATQPRLTALQTAASSRAAMHVALAALHADHKMPAVLPSASPATGLRALVAFAAQPKLTPAAQQATQKAMILAQQAVYARRVVRTLRPAKAGRTPSMAGLTLIAPSVEPAKAKAEAKGKATKAKRTA